MTQEKIRCPRCSSDLIVSVENQKHCNACSLDFDLVVKPSPRSERSRATGYGDAPKFASADLIPPRPPESFIQPKPKSSAKK
jgi:hypothetical protein